MKITDNMWLRLNYMAAHQGITYSYEDDRTMKALAKHELVRFHRAQKYGKDHWSLTEKGKEFTNKR